jgi:hypothetical protein
MPLYEVSLTIKKVDSDSKLSYYEKWLLNEIRHEPYFEPILEKVFKRDTSIASEPQDQWYVLIHSTGGKANKESSFKYGRKLIREFHGECGLYSGMKR